MIRWLPRFTLLSLLAIVLFAAGTASADLNKLDPHARIALRQLQAGDVPFAQEDGTASVLTSPGELDVFILGSVSRAQLEAAGARIRTELPGLFTAWVPVDRIEEVAALVDVTRIEGAAIYEVENNNGVTSTGADLFRSGGPTFTGLNGAGVIVGVVDTGIDYDHDDFKNPDGTTRILNIWDQTDAIGPNPPGFGYGSYWTSADIDALTSRAKDTHGHGSHTSGTAAGDGSAVGGTSAPAFTYAGMAPKADIIHVDASTTGSFSNSGMLDGVNFIFQRATAFGKNAVVNLSIGGQFGPKDGSSAFEVGMDAMAGAGRNIVFSAGNDRGANIHGEVFATVGGASATMSVNNGAVTNRRFIIAGWYNGTENMNVTVTTPNGTVIGPVVLGAMNAAYPGTLTPNGNVYVENGISTTTNGTRQVVIDVINPNGSLYNMTGTWTYTFTAVTLGPANGEIDLFRYFRSSTAFSPDFVIGNQPTREIINAIGTGLNTIAVAAWQTRQNWTDCRSALWNGPANATFGGPAVGNIATFSSPGPTRDGRMKPEIAAPGAEIASVNSADFTSTCPTGPTTLLPGLLHVINRGTSMAAPHATGAIALWMQKYGALTPAQVRALLAGRAIVDGFVTAFGPVPNKDFGSGKLFMGDMTDPTCAVTSPNGGEVIPVGSTINLTWNASDPYLGVTAVDLHLSRDNGITTEIIALNLSNSGSYSWTVTGPTTNQALLKVTARDAAGNAGTDLSDLVWAIVDPPVSTVVAQFHAESVEGGVRVAWEFTDPAAFDRIALERAAQADGPWTELEAELSAEGAATVALDRTAVTGSTYFYRLAATDRRGATMTFGPIKVTVGQPITEFAVSQVSPNPTSGEAMIEYTVPRASEVSVAMFDLQGREVATLAAGPHQPGRYQVAWSGEIDGGRANAGVYFVRVLGAGISKTRRIVVSR